MLGNPDRPIGGIAVRMPAGVELRPAGRDDLADAVALAREARGLPPLADASPLRGRFDDLINSADTTAYLAAREGQPVALAVMRFRRRLNFATFEAWLSQLALREAARGLEPPLVQALVAEWRLRGSHRIVVRLDEVAGGARDALRAAGFEAGFVNLRLRPVAMPAGRDPAGVELRPAGPEDFDVVTRLIAELGPRRSPVPDRMEAVARTYAMHLRDAEAEWTSVVVAALSGRVVGVVVTEWQRPFWADELHVWVPDLVVTEPVRGRGIGRQLLQHAMGRALEAGAAEMRLESGPQRETAQALYRSTGFEEVGETWVLRRDD